MMEPIVNVPTWVWILFLVGCVWSMAGREICSVIWKEKVRPKCSKVKAKVKQKLKQES